MAGIFPPREAVMVLPSQIDTEIRELEDVLDIAGSVISTHLKWKLEMVRNRLAALQEQNPKGEWPWG